MCDHRASDIASLARQGADTEHALRRALRLVGDTGGLSTVRRELEERGDQGALRFLERVVGGTTPMDVFAEETDERTDLDYTPRELR